MIAKEMTEAGVARLDSPDSEEVGTATSGPRLDSQYAVRLRTAIS